MNERPSASATVEWPLGNPCPRWSGIPARWGRLLFRTSVVPNEPARVTTTAATRSNRRRPRAAPTSNPPMRRNDTTEMAVSTASLDLAACFGRASPLWTALTSKCRPAVVLVPSRRKSTTPAAAARLRTASKRRRVEVTARLLDDRRRKLLERRMWKTPTRLGRQPFLGGNRWGRRKGRAVPTDSFARAYPIGHSVGPASPRGPTDCPADGSKHPLQVRAVLITV